MKSVVSSIFTSLRPNVWPRIASEMLFGASLVPHAITKLPEFLVAFLIIGPCIAGGSYLLNDITDVSSDKLHPLRGKRPVPSGLLPIQVASFTVGAIFLLALVASLFASVYLFIFCVILLFSEMLYTIRPFRFKEKAFVDIVLNAVNAFSRFAAAYAVTGGTVSQFPVSIAFFAIGIKVILFIGHRWQSRNQETQLKYTSSVVLLSTTGAKFLFVLLAATIGLLYCFSVFWYHIPLVALSYPVIVFLLLAPFVQSLRKGLLSNTEKNENFRNYLYILLLFFSVSFFLTAQAIYIR